MMSPMTLILQKVRIGATHAGISVDGKTTQKIISLIRNNPEITRTELAEQTGLSADGIKRQLKQLKDKGVIRRVGPDKGGHREIAADESEVKIK